MRGVSDSRCLVVVTRVPGSSGAKTRLAQEIGGDACARLQRALLEDTLSWAAPLASRRVLAAFPPQEASGLARHAAGWRIHPQAEAGFGERMRGAVNAGFAAGGAPVAMIATDSPTLPAHLIEEAWRRVESEADVALGPAEDGGWVLIATRAPLAPDAFAGVRWSARETLDDTVAALRGSGLRVVTTAPWYDVDTAADLDRLQRELAAGAARSLPALAAELRRSRLFMD